MADDSRALLDDADDELNLAIIKLRAIETHIEQIQGTFLELGLVDETTKISAAVALVNSMRKQITILYANAFTLRPMIKQYRDRL